MYKIGFIGMGNMASALMTGIVKSGYLKAEDICGADISDQACINAKKRGHMVFENNHEVIKHSNLVIIAVKPQVLEGVIGEVHDDLKNKAVMSIALGYDFEKYEKLLDASTRHLTIMPNTPVEVCEGMLLLEAKHSLKEDEYQFIVDMLNHIGSTEVLPSHLMNVGGALSGCGPAYLYLVIEGLADGAVKNGLPRAAAYKLASQTVLGAGKMQLETGLHPGILKDNVTSPGGSTIRGVKALEDAKVRSAFIEAVDKAC